MESGTMRAAGLGRVLYLLVSVSPYPLNAEAELVRVIPHLTRVMEALKTDHIKTVLFILRIIDKEERKSYA
jgi:hypothetical protein